MNELMKIKNIVCKKLDQIESNQLSGVYEIPFTKEDGTKQFYIGMISRKLKTRIKEHIADIKYNRRTTAFARLCSEEPLQIEFKNSKLIYPSRFFLPSIVRESIDIFLRNENICNDSMSLDLPRIWKEILSNCRNNSKN